MLAKIANDQQAIAEIIRASQWLNRIQDVIRDKARRNPDRGRTLASGATADVKSEETLDKDGIGFTNSWPRVMPIFKCNEFFQL